jgi:hypothetical protein
VAFVIIVMKPSGYVVAFVAVHRLVGAQLQFYFLGNDMLNDMLRENKQCSK